LPARLRGHSPGHTRADRQRGRGSAGRNELIERIGQTGQIRQLPRGRRLRPLSDEEVTDRISRGLATATWHYRARVTVHAPAAVIATRLPAAITIEPLDAERCVIHVGSDNPAMLALYLGMLDADFTVDPVSAPELAEHLRTVAARYARAAGGPAAPPVDHGRRATR